MEAIKLVSTENLSKIEWLKWRQKGIGGSDIASICEVNPWKSSLALYYEKTEEIKEDEEENIPAELGSYLEPFLKAKFEKWINKNEGIDIKVESLPYILQHPENTIALANVDDIFLHPIKGDCIIEYKTTSERNYKEWEEDKLPDYHYLQTQWYLYITNYRYCYIAFLIGNRKFDAKIIERNDEIINQLVEKANYFWNTFVIPKIPPAPAGDESSDKTLSLMYPKEEIGKIITIDVEKDLIAIENFNKQIKQLQDNLNLEKQYIKSLMKDAEVALCGDKKITWKEVFKKEYIVKASSLRQLRISKIRGSEKINE